GKQNARMRAGVLKKIQVLSSRIPPIRAAAVSSNLYQSHAYLWLDYRPASWNPSTHHWIVNGTPELL
ncbi:MAG: hypothetical protein Q7U82_11465, partial [Gammaproteobacteria bacterium]|nr:hypothetical protein [Gammaproteobacteria bacterium]